MSDSSQRWYDVPSYRDFIGGDELKNKQSGESEAGDRKGGISRVNRACNNCRRLKMRCVGASNPPCERCTHAGLRCVVEKPDKNKDGSDRIKKLEDQVHLMQSTLVDLVTTLRSGTGNSPNNSASSQHQQHTPQNNNMLWPSNIPQINWAIPSMPQAGPSGTRDNNAGSQIPSIPLSRAASVEAEELLESEEIVNPLGAMSNMAGLVEAAMERANEEKTNSVVHFGLPMQQKSISINDMADAKGPTITETQYLPPRPKLAEVKRKTHVHAFPDAVAEGIVSEAEGRELFETFYRGSVRSMPCYDPSVDTWESLRHRSPFSITTMIMVGARVRDRGGPPGAVQQACRNLAQRIAVGTLFHPVARIEAVQAMTLLAGFSDQGWLPGGHAVRMAIDMGVNRSFGHLLRSGMGKGKSAEELEKERHLVVHSRMWFCLYLFEHQLAYGMGRPAILREDESIQNCRKFLEHPLSIPTDIRLIYTVELLALRAPLHVELTASPDTPISGTTLTRLKSANKDFDAWEKYWSAVIDKPGAPGGPFFVVSLRIQRQYAELFVNSQLLRGIREPSDVIGMSAEKRSLALRAMKNAQNCLDICIQDKNYQSWLAFAGHYTHVCAAFAASFLIRITRLFPNEINPKKVAKDVEELAKILADVPAGRYARSLRLILRRARKARLLPAASRPASPGPASRDTFKFPTFTQNTSPIDQSPVDMTEFDSLFTQENLERAGLSLGEGDDLPLFLDTQSLGAAPAHTETPYMGMEQFFLPVDVDNRLGDREPDFGNEVWW